jgi:hypothetical protein
MNFSGLEKIEKCSNVLIAGIGGGYDVLGSVPLAIELHKRCINVTISSLNTSGATDFEKVSSNTEVEPERSFYRWLEFMNKNMVPGNWFHCRNIPLYLIPKTGPLNMAKMYRKIKEDESIDGVILVDGGVDSLMRGDEEGCGTIFEDSMSMSAIQQAFPDQLKILACVGLGAETEEGVDHARVLSYIAEYQRDKAFLGCCSMVQDDDFKTYESACRATWANSRKSHIHTRVISAVYGAFGDRSITGGADDLREGIDARILVPEKESEFITPLMAMYWFFEFEPVAAKNLLLPHFKNASTTTDALMVYRQIMPELLKNRKGRMKLPY